MLQIEYRRKSGRTVGGDALSFVMSREAGAKGRVRFGLLKDHVAFKKDEVKEEQMGGADSTWSLELTEKQRRDREGVVLPYFDAQKEGGGEGGRILYEFGEEDFGDWDEEEDEI